MDPGTAAAFLVVCITASSAAFAAGKTGRSADGLSCGFSGPENAAPAVRRAAIKRQCGGKFYANACGEGWCRRRIEERVTVFAARYLTTPDVKPALRRGGLISFFRKQRASRPV